MDMITPDMHQKWLRDLKNDKASFNQEFIQIKNIDELRRVVARQTYGTKPYKRGEQEAPFLQAILDQDGLLDLSDRSDVIDVN